MSKTKVKEKELKVKREFVGLKPDDKHPHLLEYFTDGVRYELFIENGFRHAYDDTGKKIMISNNARKEYFR